MMHERGIHGETVGPDLAQGQQATAPQQLRQLLKVLQTRSGCGGDAKYYPRNGSSTASPAVGTI